jgi:uncharacterized membrane protein
MSEQDSSPQPDQPPQYVSYPRTSSLPPAGRVRFEALSEAFSFFGEKWQAWVVAALPLVILSVVWVAYYFVSGVGLMGTNPLTEVAAFMVTMGLSLVYGLVLYVYTAGLVAMALKQVRGEEISAADGLLVFKSLPNLLVGVLLSGLAVLVGAMFCIVPGLIINGLLMLTIPLIIDRKLSPVAAMQASWDTVKSDMWTATGLMFVLYLLYSISTNFVIGVVVGAPIYALGIAIVYRDFFITPEIIRQGGPAFEPTPYVPPQQG